MKEGEALKYYDLPKNKMSDFLGDKKSTCELWTMRPGGGLHWHDYYTVDIIVEGEAEKFNALGHTQVKKGYMHLVMPSDIHHIGTDGFCRLYSIRFSPEVMPDGLEKLLSTADKSVQLGEKELGLAAGMAETMLAFPEDERLCLNMLESLLLVLQSRIKLKSDGITDDFRKIMNYIDINFRDNPTLQQAAKVGSYSAGYFSHLFRTVTGYTYTEYLNAKKINYACAIMKKKGLTLTDIALSSGFSSFASFSRCFKSVMGQSPKEYRSKR